MSESMFLYVAIFVFVMMMIGLGLTMWEFRYGQPRREDKQDHYRPSAPRGPARVALEDAAP
jgi:hypothetical protein